MMHTRHWMWKNGSVNNVELTFIRAYGNIRMINNGQMDGRTNILVVVVDINNWFELNVTLQNRLNAIGGNIYDTDKCDIFIFSNEFVLFWWIRFVCLGIDQSAHINTSTNVSCILKGTGDHLNSRKNNNNNNNNKHNLVMPMFHAMRANVCFNLFEHRETMAMCVRHVPHKTFTTVWSQSGSLFLSLSLSHSFDSFCCCVLFTKIHFSCNSR